MSGLFNYLKQYTVLKKSVTIQSSQMFHLTENSIVTIHRTNKPGSPVERHLLTGFSRPIAQSGAMELNCTSVSDFPVASPYPLPDTQIYATIAVTVQAGTVVTCAKNGTTLTAISTGTAVFTVPSYGEWTIEGKLSGKSGSSEITVDSPGLYTVELTLITKE